jgi:hypothetical protein
MTIRALFPVFALLACSDGTAPAPSIRPGPADLAAIVTQETAPFSGPACNGDVVTGSADRHTVINSINTPGGRMMNMIMIDETITGVGLPSNTKYQGQSHAKTQANNGTHGASVLKVTSRYTLHGDNVPDTQIETVTMFVMNANGTPVVTKVSQNSSCS